LGTIYSIFDQIYSKTYDYVLCLSFYQDMLERASSKLNIREDGRYLDIGTGTGNLLMKILENAECEIVGIDTSPGMLKIASNKLRNNPSVSFIYANTTYPLPFKDESFDGVACLSTIYFLENLFDMLKETKRILKPRKNIVISSPKGIEATTLERTILQDLQERGSFKDMFAYFVNSVINRWMEYELEKEGSFHIYRDEEIIALLDELNFREIEIEDIYEGYWYLVKATKYCI